MAGISTLTYGGTLTVTNLAGTLAQGRFLPVVQRHELRRRLRHHEPARPRLWPHLEVDPGQRDVAGGGWPDSARLKRYWPTAGGFALTFSGPSGQTYKVLGSTNVALPLTSWSVLTSGTFGASPVSYTNTPATAPQEFYRVVSP